MLIQCLQNIGEGLLRACISSKFINLASSVRTEKYRTSVFLYKPHPTGSVCTKETSVRYFSVHTSRLVNDKLIILDSLVGVCSL